MLQKGNNLEGIRLYGEDGEIMESHTWQDSMETGKWSDIQTIPQGQQIIGLKVNRPHLSIARIAFLLLDSENDSN